MCLFPRFIHWQSSARRWCRLIWEAWEKLLPHFSHVNGFCPVWVRTWLFSVVAPANVREQKPHLNGRSLLWVTTWARSFVGSANDKLQWPHWNGLFAWLGHTWSLSAERCVNRSWHWPHFQTPISLSSSTLACVGERSSVGDATGDAESGGELLSDETCLPQSL